MELLKVFKQRPPTISFKKDNPGQTNSNKDLPHAKELSNTVNNGFYRGNHGPPTSQTAGSIINKVQQCVPLVDSRSADKPNKAHRMRKKKKYLNWLKKNKKKSLPNAHKIPQNRQYCEEDEWFESPIERRPKVTDQVRISQSTDNSLKKQFDNIQPINSYDLVGSLISTAKEKNEEQSVTAVGSKRTGSIQERSNGKHLIPSETGDGRQNVCDVAHKVPKSSISTFSKSTLKTTSQQVSFQQPTTLNPSTEDNQLIKQLKHRRSSLHTADDRAKILENLSKQKANEIPLVKSKSLNKTDTFKNCKSINKRSYKSKSKHRTETTNYSNRHSEAKDGIITLMDFIAQSNNDSSEQWLNILKDVKSMMSSVWTDNPSETSNKATNCGGSGNPLPESNAKEINPTRTHVDNDKTPIQATDYSSSSPLNKDIPKIHHTVKNKIFKKENSKVVIRPAFRADLLLKPNLNTNVVENSEQQTKQAYALQGSTSSSVTSATNSFTDEVKHEAIIPSDYVCDQQSGFNIDQNDQSIISSGTDQKHQIEKEYFESIFGSDTEDIGLTTISRKESDDEIAVENLCINDSIVTISSTDDSDNDDYHVAKRPKKKVTLLSHANGINSNSSNDECLEETKDKTDNIGSYSKTHHNNSEFVIDTTGDKSGTRNLSEGEIESSGSDTEFIDRNPNEVCTSDMKSSVVEANRRSERQKCIKEKLCSVKRLEDTKQDILKIAKKVEKKRMDATVANRVKHLPIDLSIASIEGNNTVTATKKRGRGKKKSKANKRDNRAKRQKIIETKIPCTFYMKSACNKGDDCPFSHDFKPTKRPTLCKYYVVDACNKEEDCPYMHNDFPCKFFHLFKGCQKGMDCKFSHSPLNEETENILKQSIAIQNAENSPQPQINLAINKEDSNTTAPIKDYNGLLFTEVTDS